MQFAPGYCFWNLRNDRGSWFRPIGQSSANQFCRKLERKFCCGSSFNFKYISPETDANLSKHLATHSHRIFSISRFETGDNFRVRGGSQLTNKTICWNELIASTPRMSWLSRFTTPNEFEESLRPKNAFKWATNGKQSIYIPDQTRPRSSLENSENHISVSWSKEDCYGSFDTEQESREIRSLWLMIPKLNR